MPADRTQKISDAVAQALNNPDFQARVRALGLTPAFAGPQALANLQSVHLKRWETPIKASGFTMEQ